jgi:hypothetical protein
VLKIDLATNFKNRYQPPEKEYSAKDKKKGFAKRKGLSTLASEDQSVNENKIVVK